MKIEFNNLEKFLAFCREVETKREIIWDAGWAEGIDCQQAQIDKLKEEITILKNKSKQQSVAK